MMQSFKKVLRTTFLLSFFNLAVFLVSNPGECISVAKTAVSLCLDTVIPSLFPFLIFSGFFFQSGMGTVCGRFFAPLMRPLFNLPGSGAAAFVLGMVSGYPIGAVSAAKLYTTGQCTKSEAERMCAFCNNSGPLFVMSVVGEKFLGNHSLGILLYLSHILSAIITGILLKNIGSKDSQPKNRLGAAPKQTIKSGFLSLGSVMDSSCLTMLKICGFVVFFSVFAVSFPKSAISPYLHGFLEITGGIKEISGLSFLPDLRLPLISFFIAFSGISVLLQVSSVISDCGLSLRTYFFGKLLQGGISAIITIVLVRIFPVAHSVFKNESSAELSAEPGYYFVFALKTLLCFLIIALLLCIISSKTKRTRKSN